MASSGRHLDDVDWDEDVGRRAKVGFWNEWDGGNALESRAKETPKENRTGMPKTNKNHQKVKKLFDNIAQYAILVA